MTAQWQWFGLVCGVAGTACGSDGGGADHAAVGGSSGHTAAGSGGASTAGGHSAAITAAGGTTTAVTATSVELGRSCQGMTGTECQGESCCTHLSVPAGTFLMGRGTSTSATDYSAEGYSVETPEHSVTVSAYSLDKYEVTVGRFRRFLQSDDWVPATGTGEHPHISGTDWQSEWDARLPTVMSGTGGWNDVLACLGLGTWTAEDSGDDTLPMSCVNWYAAAAFCVWDGGRLPTEAEWEYAAAGGDENRLYPWGSAAPTCELANFNGCSKQFDAVGEHSGDGRFGHRDLGGNVGEWTFDWYALSFYSDAAATGADICNATEGTARSQRGGSYYTNAAVMRAARRGLSDPAGLNLDSIGVRCARSM